MFLDPTLRNPIYNHVGQSLNLTKPNSTYIKHENKWMWYNRPGPLNFGITSILGNNNPLISINTQP